MCWANVSVGIVGVDFFCLSTRSAVHLMGDLVTLLIIQSRGWPFLLTFWSLTNFAVLSGAYKIAEHWLYWQDLVGIFNEENPSGSAASNDWNRTVLTVGVIVGVVVFRVEWLWW